MFTRLGRYDGPPDRTQRRGTEKEAIADEVLWRPVIEHTDVHGKHSDNCPSRTRSTTTGG